MIFTPLPLTGAFAIDMQPHHDARGSFARSFCADTFAAQGLCSQFVQMNTSYNRHAGTLRGLHFQRAPATEIKMVRCLRGAVFDVIVDLRAGSASYGHWTALELSQDNRRMIYIPRGFAHGFQSLLPDTELLYWHDTAYAPGFEAGLLHSDLDLAIVWPLPIDEISPRDADLPRLIQLEPIFL